MHIQIVNVRQFFTLIGDLIQSSIGDFWGVTQASLLENSFKRKHLVENNISRILGRHTLNRYSWFLIDEFSSKTACLTTRKMKVSEKISFFHYLPIRVNKIRQHIENNCNKDNWIHNHNKMEFLSNRWGQRLN